MSGVDRWRAILPLLVVVGQESNTSLASGSWSGLSHLQLDFEGPLDGHFLVLVNVHSKWVDVITIRTNHLESADGFADIGIPESIVTHKGPNLCL